MSLIFSRNKNNYFIITVVGDGFPADQPIAQYQLITALELDENFKLSTGKKTMDALKKENPSIK